MNAQGVFKLSTRTYVQDGQNKTARNAVEIFPNAGNEVNLRGVDGLTDGAYQLTGELTVQNIPGKDGRAGFKMVAMEVKQAVALNLDGMMAQLMAQAAQPAAKK